MLGETFGLTVRSRHVGSQIGAGFKSLLGGELKGMTKMLAEGREQAIQRLVEEAEAKGANAIIAMRFDTSEFMEQATEICAYGTAVTAARRGAGRPAGDRRKPRGARRRSRQTPARLQRGGAQAPTTSPRGLGLAVAASRRSASPRGSVASVARRSRSAPP